MLFLLLHTCKVARDMFAPMRGKAQVHAPRKSRLWGSNPRPHAYEAHALPTELRRQLRIAGGGPYTKDFLATAHHVTMPAENADVVCLGPIVPPSGHPST